MNCSPRPLNARSIYGFTLIELMITVAVIAILAAIAVPSYREYVIRSSRQAAQSKLVELSAIQEKIYLNSNGYTSSVTANYNGTAEGGLGVGGGKTADNKYNLSLTVPSGSASYTLTATPVTGQTQANDGNLTINSQGSRAWGSKTW
jgi:type IV pilus assembly protein PilE